MSVFRGSVHCPGVSYAIKRLFVEPVLFFESVFENQQADDAVYDQNKKRNL